MNKLNLKAFTIIEVIITMLISAIVIGITYTAFSIVNRSYILYHKRSDDLSTLVSFDKILSRDVNKADTILQSDNGIVLSNNGNIKYEFLQDFILRTGTVVDTFKIKARDISFSFENKFLSSLISSPEQHRIDDLQFNLFFQDKKISYHYHKDYSSADLINSQQNAIN